MTNVSSCTAIHSVPTEAELMGCGQPLLIDLSGIGWDDTLGRSTLDRAKYVCYSRYHGCLSRLTRVTQLSFRALCKRKE